MTKFKQTWAKVGKTERRNYVSACGICGCKSNLWVTVGSTQMGIKTVLACPGRKRLPDLHDKIMWKQNLLWEDKLPVSVQEELVLEILGLRAKFATVEPDMEAVVK